MNTLALTSSYPSWYSHWRKLKNVLFLAPVILCSLLVFVPLLFILTHVLKNGLSALSWDFLTQMPKPMGETGGGIYHAIIGTIYMLFIGGTIGTLWGLSLGIFLNEMATGKIKAILRQFVDLMNSTPSIIIGLFAYLLLVVPFKTFSALAGAFALSLVILPAVVRSTEEILKLIPSDIREAGLALGIPRVFVILRFVVWGARFQLLPAILLSLARASGETAPLLFTAFGNMALSLNPLAPMASLPLQIYTYALSPYENSQQQAWAGAFVLMSLVFSLGLLAKLMIYLPTKWGTWKQNWIQRK